MYGATRKIIYVPDGSVEAYKAADGWSAYANNIHSMNELSV